MPGDVRSQLPHPHRACVCGNVIRVTEQASGSAKIDPLMAAFNAIALMSTNPWFLAIPHSRHGSGLEISRPAAEGLTGPCDHESREPRLEGHGASIVEFDVLYAVCLTGLGQQRKS